MEISSLILKNFRNYNKLQLNFSPKLNIIYGKNGTGKTNLVEAIYVLALSKTFRINNDKVLIKKGAENGSIAGEILKNNNQSTYKIIISNEGKKVEINHTKIDKMSDYVGRINVILFNPSDTGLISASPNDRRLFINIEISQLYKEYLIVLTKYNRILKQRNSYLKQASQHINKDYLDILTHKLIEYGKTVNNYREEFIKNINKYIGKIYNDIFMQGEIQIKYVSTYNNKDENSLWQMYENNYAQEIKTGKTMFGIHHDDFVFKLDNEVLKEWGSEGQRKNSIISFKLAELKIINEIKKTYPILILDDLFSELDNEKITNILTMLNDEVQTFITTTEIDKVSEEIINKSKIFECLGGKIKEEV